ncbi:HEPN domain-containing protein [Candidatus Poribacteria bacterium]|nr:HEPN domain-containing protein [Candidatus Poribacteria bacterium]
MNPITLEWVEIAEGDYDAAKQIQQGPNPIYRIICFHAQQCAEKYLKAWLQEANIPASRTHNLVELLGLILPSQPSWNSWKADLAELSKHAVDTRYLGQLPTAEDAEHAMQICGEVRQAVRTHLKLPIEENENNHE